MGVNDNVAIGQYRFYIGKFGLYFTSHKNPTLSLDLSRPGYDTNSLDQEDELKYYKGPVVSHNRLFGLTIPASTLKDRFLLFAIYHGPTIFPSIECNHLCNLRVVSVRSQ